MISFKLESSSDEYMYIICPIVNLIPVSDPLHYTTPKDALSSVGVVVKCKIFL